MYFSEKTVLKIWGCLVFFWVVVLVALFLAVVLM